MKSFKIYITRRIPEAGIEVLRPHAQVEIFPEERPIPREVLREKVRHVEGLLCLLSDTIDREIIDAAPQLRVISNYAVGYNNIDVEYATRKGIVVTNTPGVLTDATADLTWALLLAVTRRIVEGDRFMRQGKFNGWGPMLLLGQDIKGKTLGIVGAGRIGTAVAERSRGWEMNILYYNRGRNAYLEEHLNARMVELEELLAQSDFVSLHVPLTPETHHLIDEKALRSMKKSAYLINTSRGAVVDEQALVRALREGWIAGAALDVYEHEPQLTPGLSELPNVVLAPHIGSATFETRNKMATIAAYNILDVLQGKKPLYPVNPEVLEKSHSQ